MPLLVKCRIISWLFIPGAGSNDGTVLNFTHCRIKSVLYITAAVMKIPLENITNRLVYKINCLYRAGCVGGQEKEWMGCFLDDLRAFGIDAEQWTTAAQDEGEWQKTAEQGAERFMAKWIAADKVRAGLRHAVG